MSSHNNPEMWPANHFDNLPTRQLCRLEIEVSANLCQLSIAKHPPMRASSLFCLLISLVSLSPTRTRSARVRIPIRQRRVPLSSPLQTHVFTLPRACKSSRCQGLAADALRLAGCSHILELGSLQMIKARCSLQSASRLAKDRRRFIDVARDARLHLAAAAPIARMNMTKHDSRQDFERIGTVRFTAGVGTGEANSSGGLEGVSLHDQELSRRCFPRQGLGVTVYVIDTGCRTSHAELSGRAWCVPAPGSAFTSGEDDHGHGTHSAARIAGGRIGLASRAQVVCIKALDRANRGSATDVVAGLALASRLHRQDGGAGGGVASVSLGVRVGKRYTALDEAVRRARKAGLVVVAAAGNEGGDACEFTPARSDAAIAVAASGAGGKVARFSNRGRCVGVAAPGVHVWSAGCGGDEIYARASGTSMAAPYVSGVAALLMAEGVKAGMVRSALGSGRGGREMRVVGVKAVCRWNRRRRRRRRLRIE